MQTIKTSYYPTRYAAFNNPGLLVEHSQPIHRVGFEFAVYHEPIVNTIHPYIEDGIYISICSYQGSQYMLECHLTEPIEGRKQWNMTERYNSYEEAKKNAVTWLQKAQARLKSIIIDRQLAV